MRFSAFVVTFNRPLILKKTIEQILQQTYPPDLILVVDNGCSKETECIVEAFSNRILQYKAMEDNLGPAGAIAYALQWLQKEGYEWIYWGDDDDPPYLPDTFERLLRIAIENHGPTIGGVGVVGAKWDWIKGEIKRLPDLALTGTIDVDVIGGGQQFIVNKKVIEQIGVPNASFFFGLDDIEYCLRIKQAGYRLLADGNLMHEGRTRTGRLNFTAKTSILPRLSYKHIWRQYYTTRNYIFMMQNTFNRPDLARREMIKSIGRATTSWSFGPTYGNHFTQLQIRGVMDGYQGRMGRTVSTSPKSK